MTPCSAATAWRIWQRPICAAPTRALHWPRPSYGDLAGLPPLLIHVGEREVLRDDSVRLAERARAAGVPVELQVWPVVPHVWQFAHALVPEARRSLAAAAAFLHHASAVT